MLEVDAKVPATHPIWMGGPGEHEVKPCVHVGHLHSGSVQEEDAFDGLERVAATPSPPHFLRLELVKHALRDSGDIS